MTTKLYTAQTGNDTLAAVPVTGFVQNTLYAFGTFDTATIALEASPDGGTTWLAVTDASFTEAGMIRLDFAATHIRAVVSSVGGSTSLSFWIL